jgi:hypothetical protein
MLHVQRAQAEEAGTANTIARSFYSCVSLPSWPSQEYGLVNGEGT